MNIYYLLSDSHQKSENVNLKLGNLVMSHRISNKNILHKENQKNQLIMIGDFVDCLDAKLTPEHIADKLLNAENIWELIEKSRTLAGRYLILASIDGQLFVLPDPVCSIPVNYYFNASETAVSSDAKIIAEKNGFEVSETATKIKSGAEQQQPLPNDLTMFDEIKTLIPNHYLDVTNQKSVRFFPLSEQTSVSMDDAVQETITKSKEIIRGFKDRRPLSIPLTSGVDSRTVLALMKEYKDDIPAYTYFHENFSMETSDIKIPLEITETLNIDYRILKRKSIPQKNYERIQEEFSGLENRRILENGYTYSQSDIKQYSAVPGDIISISKSPFGRNLPESLATVDYFMTKTHNSSSVTKKYIKEWMKEAKPYSQRSGISLFDLFNLEYRLGRWLPNNIKNYDVFVDQTYIFNCRYLIEMWINIPKKERTSRSLHLEIIKREWPELLNLEFNPDEKVIDRIFDNSYMFYLGSFGKYYMNRLKSKQR